MADRLPTAAEQAFLVRLAELLIDRKGFGLSFELDGPRLRITAYSPYAAPTFIVVYVDQGSHYRVRSENRCLITIHDVATRLIGRVRRGSQR